MKYLRGFNEEREIATYESLKKMCDNYLSYIKDDGFTIYIGHSKAADIVTYHIKIVKFSERSIQINYKWSNICDDFIPFLNIVNSKYGVRDIVVNGYNGGASEWFSVDDILNNSIEDSTFNCMWLNIVGGDSI